MLPVQETPGCDRSGRTCLIRWPPPKTSYRLCNNTWLFFFYYYFENNFLSLNHFADLELTILVGSIHGQYFFVAPGGQDLNEGVFVSPSTLSINEWKTNIFNTSAEIVWTSFAILCFKGLQLEVSGPARVRPMCMSLGLN